MIRFAGVAFVLALATSAQAMSPAPLHQQDGMTTQARQLPPCYAPGQVRKWGCPRCKWHLHVGGTSPGPPPRATANVWIGVKAFALNTSDGVATDWKETQPRRGGLPVTDNLSLSYASEEMI